MLLYEFKADLNAYLAALRAGRAASSRSPTSSRSTRRTRRARCRTSARSSSCARRGEGAARRARRTARRWRRTCRLSRDGGHRRGDERAPARRAGRADRRAGLARPTSSTATTSPAAASTAAGGGRLSAHHGAGGIRRSGCRSACRSSAGAWSEPTLIRSPTRSSRRPSTGGRRGSCPRRNSSSTGPPGPAGAAAGLQAGDRLRRAHLKWALVDCTNHF